MRRLARPTMIALAPLLLIAGCASDPGPSDAGPGQPGEQSTVTPVPEPSPTPITLDYSPSLSGPAAAGPHASLAFPFTDRDGYTYEVSAWVVMSEPTTDITQSKPGFTKLSYDLVGEVTIANTTQGREATLEDHDLLRMGPYWENRRGSDPCPIGAVEIDRSGWSSDSDAGVPCTQTARIIDAAHPSSLVIPAGGETTQSLALSVSTDIAESEAADHIATAVNPDGWLAAMPLSEADDRAQASTCRLRHTIVHKDNPHIYAATQQLRNCALSSIIAPQATAPDPATSQAARARLEAEIAEGDVVDDTSSAYPCPAGSVAGVTRGITDIEKVELTKTVAGDLAGNPYVDCDGGQVSLTLAPRTNANGLPELTAGLRADSLVGTTESDLYGGKFYAWCIEDPSPSYSLQNQCGATWYDDNLVITGHLAQYEDSTDQDRADRLSRWLSLQVPGILQRLADGS